MEKYQAVTPKTKNKAELKTVLETIWADVPQEPTDRSQLTDRFWRSGNDFSCASQQRAVILNINSSEVPLKQPFSGLPNSPFQGYTIILKEINNIIPMC